MLIVDAIVSKADFLLGFKFMLVLFWRIWFSHKNLQTLFLSSWLKNLGKSTLTNWPAKMYNKCTILKCNSIKGAYFVQKSYIYIFRGEEEILWNGKKMWNGKMEGTLLKRKLEESQASSLSFWKCFTKKCAFCYVWTYHRSSVWNAFSANLSAYFSSAIFTEFSGFIFGRFFPILLQHFNC